MQWGDALLLLLFLLWLNVDIFIAIKTTMQFMNVIKPDAYIVQMTNASIVILNSFCPKKKNIKNKIKYFHIWMSFNTFKNWWTKRSQRAHQTYPSFKLWINCDEISFEILDLIKKNPNQTKPQYIQRIHILIILYGEWQSNCNKKKEGKMNFPECEHLVYHRYDFSWG